MSKKNRETDRAGRAAAALAEQQRQERRRRNLMVGGVVGGLIAIVAVIVVVSTLLAPKVDAPAAGSDFGLTIGPDDAPNKVIIYEDFLCPYCGELESATRDDLAQLAADGKVQVEYRPFDLLGGGEESSYSVRSAGAFSIVLEKSGAETAKAFHDLLFENQPSEAGPFPKSSELADLAVEAGAKDSDVRAAIEADDGNAWVVEATQAASDAGVHSTPTVLLNDEVFQDGRTIDQMADNLIKKLQ